MSKISPKLLFLLAFSLVALVVSSGARAATPNHTTSAPAWAELAKYPIVPAIDVPKTSIAGLERSADLGLRSVRLTAPVVMLNHYRGVKGGVAESWRLEEISAGTVVLVDVAGAIRYKADCWNRLAPVAQPTPDVGFWDLIVKAWNAALEWVGGVLGAIGGFFASVWGAFLESNMGPEWLLVLPGFFAVWIAERQRQAAMGGNHIRQNVP